MLRRAVWAWGSGALVMLGSAVAHAQCTKDTDCKGDRVCEAGKCTSPALPDAPPPPPGSEAGSTTGEAVTLEEDPAAEGKPAGEAAPAPAVAAAPAKPAPDAKAQSGPTAAVAPLAADEPEVRRRSRGMMVGGIVMVSIGPLALLGALSARNSQESCDENLENRYPDHRVPAYDQQALERCDSYTTPIYVFGIAGAVLIAAGVPMIIYGGKNVTATPGPRAQLLPWASPSSGGLRLRVDL